MAAKQIIVSLEQSKREDGPLTKNMVKYDENNRGKIVRTMYISQQELLNQFGKFPQCIAVYIISGDPVEGAVEVKP